MPDGCVRHVRKDARIHGLQQRPELRPAGRQIFWCELIGNVPSNSSETSPLVHHGMEEAQSKYQASMNFWNLASTIKFLFAHAGEGLQELGTNSSWSSICHLYACLQDHYWKFKTRGRREPQSEISMDRLWFQIFPQSLKLRHPRHTQVAIAQQHPTTEYSSLLHQLFRSGSLSLAQRDEVELIFQFHLDCQCAHFRHRICTTLKHENQWRRVRGIVEARRKIQSKWSDVFVTKLSINERAYASHHTIHADGPQQAQTLETVQSVFPITWQSFFLWLKRLVKFLPLTAHNIERDLDAGEGMQTSECQYPIPFC
mmetsp:Transcript_10894/g.17971  ORF Transcript_10894/g.17971 Transcript_10894/m.17971 type:complete len:313 (-) Transcript_10894:1057-1995(-)